MDIHGPCKPEVRPGAREESASSAWLAASTNSKFIYLCPPLKKEGHIALHMSVGRSVGMSVSLNLVQMITQERFAPEASNLVGR